MFGSGRVVFLLKIGRSIQHDGLDDSYCINSTSTICE